MATWQFDVQLYQQALDEPLPATTREAAEHLLPQLFGVGDEMLDRWFVFGSEVGNRVDLLVLDDGGCEIHARFDARASGTDEFVMPASLPQRSTATSSAPSSMRFSNQPRHPCWTP